MKNTRTVWCAACALVVGGLVCGLIAGPARGQCLLANPSFEIGGGPAGWNQFGNVSYFGRLAVHGGRSAAVRGPNSGGWDLSAVWQAHDAQAGDRFRATVRVGHDANDPLVGAARGIVNIEWRDAGGSLIDFESSDVLTTADATGEMRTHTIETGPAPAGTVSTRLLLAFLQSPSQESGTVFYDLVEFYELTTPSYDAQQWNDFPGGRRLDFGGYSWRVKGPGFFGPGPNVFRDTTQNVWVDEDGMHLTIRREGSDWVSTEVTLEEPLGYGDYVFTTKGDLDALHPNAVLGLFIWQYPTCFEPDNAWNQHNEVDVEISRWGNAADPNVAQFVIQPFNIPGNIFRYAIDYTVDDMVSYAFNWLPDRIEFRCWYGTPEDESDATMIREWTYTGDYNARPEQPRVHLNLWHINPPSSNQEVVLADFRFTPACARDRDGDGKTTIAELYADHEQPADLNFDGVIDASDRACLEAWLRAGEIEDMIGTQR